MEEEKEKEELKEEKKESPFRKALSLFVWIVIFAWVGACLVDYFNVSN